MSLLEVTNLRVSFPTSDGLVQAVRGVSFRVEPGQTLGIVGESGSGKTVSTQALLALTPGADISGRAMFNGVNLLALGENQMRHIRGAQIATIFQDPLTSLHPLYKVGWQIAEMIRAHDGSVTKAQARKQAVDLLTQVGIPEAARRVDDYPHQFSGGMRQRAMIAMALSLNPTLIICDEPTTALDATVQAQILDVLQRLQREFNTALIMITHDLGVIADMVDSVMVMYAGRAAEYADRRTLFYQPHHPYTIGLLESIPGSAGAEERLQPIPGQPPSLINVPSGCAFNPRCRYVMDRCISETPPLITLESDAGGHRSACWLPQAALGLGAEAEESRDGAVAAGRTDRSRAVAKASAATIEARGERGMTAATAPAPAGDVLLRIDSLVKYYPVRAGVLFKHEVASVKAVDGVDLALRQGETLGLVGETGSGKSTLARCIAGLHPVTSGRITFDGSDVTNLTRRRMQPFRRDIQMIFQDPYGSLNPRRRVGSIIGDPFTVHNVATGNERKRMVQDLMERVGLNPEHYNRFPAEFSGGQRQRIGVARALALRPKLIICDEPVSALDVSIQAQILNLLEDLQDDFGLTYLFIAHDLSVVRHVSDRVAVMYLGKIAEIGETGDVYGTGRHPYTRALLSASPAADPDEATSRQRIILVGDIPSPLNPPSGCRFHPRCPKAQELCRQIEPPLEVKSGDQETHRTACHFPVEMDEDLATAASVLRDRAEPSFG